MKKILALIFFANLSNAVPGIHTPGIIVKKEGRKISVNWLIYMNKHKITGHNVQVESIEQANGGKDIAFLISHFQSNAMNTFGSGKPREAFEIFERGIVWAKRWYDGNLASGMVIKIDEKYAGHVGLGFSGFPNQTLDQTDQEYAIAEIAYALEPEFQHKGYTKTILNFLALHWLPLIIPDEQGNVIVDKAKKFTKSKPIGAITATAHIRSIASVKFLQQAGFSGRKNIGNVTIQKHILPEIKLLNEKNLSIEQINNLASIIEEKFETGVFEKTKGIYHELFDENNNYIITVNWSHVYNQPKFQFEILNSDLRNNLNNRLIQSTNSNQLIIDKKITQNGYIITAEIK